MSVTRASNRRGAMADVLTHDVWLGCRSLWGRPAFAAAAIATLALGIGASSAMFSVAYGIALRPLPYPQSDRLIRIYEANLAHGQIEQDVSVGAFHDWRAGSTSLEASALFSKASPRTLGVGGHRLTTMSVSPAFFDVLGVRPILGPGFKAERDYTRFTTDEVVLSHDTWQRVFGGRPDVIGAPMAFVGVGDDDVYRIVGVLPQSFSFTQPVDVWRPQIVEVPVARILRNWRYDRVIARLKPGAALHTARAELEVVAERLARDFPASNAGWTVTAESMHDSIVGSFGPATWLLLAAVAVVLLVACLNVGGLLVARTITRQRETAVRMALGAGLWRLLRLWFAEAAILALLGAACGVLFAWWGVTALKVAAPPGIPRLDAIALDLPSLVVAALSTVLAIVIFTAAPLGVVPRRGWSGHLRTGSSGSAGGRDRRLARGSLTIAQCAGAAALVVLAVMLTRSFLKLTSFDLGWNPNGVLSVQASPRMPQNVRRPWYLRVEWADRLLTRLDAMPGVDRAAISTQRPLATSYPATLARGRGKAADDDARWPGVQQSVTDAYFQVMGIRLVSGRTFGWIDRFGEEQINQIQRADHGVAVVTEQTARTLWPGQSAIGQALWLPDIDNVAWRDVVGVVADIQFHAVGETPALHVFVPWTQSSTGTPYVLVKSADPGTSMTAAVRDVVQRVEPGSAIDDVATLDALVERATEQPRFTSRIVVAFGALALALAAVGIHGTLSYLVGARTREIGIRLALGASRRSILLNVIWRGVVPAIMGGLIGLALALALAHTFHALLFEVAPFDPASLAGGAAVLLAVAVFAALNPARRAARVEPSQALRAE